MPLLEGVDLIRALLEADAAGQQRTGYERLPRPTATCRKPANGDRLDRPRCGTVRSTCRHLDEAAFAGLDTSHLEALADELGTDAQVYAIRFLLPPTHSSEGSTRWYSCKP